MEIDKNLEMLEKFANSLIEFGVTYGFQIFGALVFLLIGLKIAGWLGRKVSTMAEIKEIDVTLSKFIDGRFANVRSARLIPARPASLSPPCELLTQQCFPLGRRSTARPQTGGSNGRFAPCSQPLATAFISSGFLNLRIFRLRRRRRWWWRRRGRGSKTHLAKVSFR